VAAALPTLPFPDRSFDLVLSSHLLFSYTDRLDVAFHLAALLELARVSRGQVRVFPLVDYNGHPQPTLLDQLPPRPAPSRRRYRRPAGPLRVSTRRRLHARPHRAMLLSPGRRVETGASPGGEGVQPDPRRRLTSPTAELQADRSGPAPSAPARAATSSHGSSLAHLAAPARALSWRTLSCRRAALGLPPGLHPYHGGPTQISAPPPEGHSTAQ